MEKILVLGASGSIGTQSLELLENEKEQFAVVGLAFGYRRIALEDYLRRFPTISRVSIADAKQASFYQKRYPSLKIYSGENGVLSLIEESDFDGAVNALVGIKGLEPSLRILERKANLYLANKESLYVGGALINRLLKDGGQLFPIDSEHVAIDKCLQRLNGRKVKRLILTASGGPFRSRPLDTFKTIKAEEALKHPTWKMGKRITIDCATMVNKGFEVGEAFWLFSYPLEQIDVLIHHESRIHSMVEVEDGTFLADIGINDMRGPISYALHKRKIPFEIQEAKDFHDFGDYHFQQLDLARYPAFSLALAAFKKGGVYPAIFNAADEEAVQLFVDEKISFLEIAESISCLLKEAPSIIKPGLTEIQQADAWARKRLHEILGK